MRNLILIVSLIGLLHSCKKEVECCVILNEDYFIFGHFYGECFGEVCIETFKLEGGKLYEDEKDAYGGYSDFSFIELEDTLYQKVKDLWTAVPDGLRNDTTEVFGCPDCADGGGLYIELNEAGLQRHWRIDQDKDNAPEYLHDFMDQVNEKIALIND